MNRRTQKLERDALCEMDEERNGGFEIERVLVISTGHLQQATMERLSAGDSGYASNEYAVFVYTGTLTDEGGEPELVAAYELARDLGCGWIKFDCDGPVVDELPTFNW